MRFNIDLVMEKKELPKDKNRIFISFLKNIFESYDEDEFLKLYDLQNNVRKNFTFSLFLPGAKFEKETIRTSSEKIIFNFSAYDYPTGIAFYNSIIKSRKRQFPLTNNNEFSIENIRLEREQIIRGNKATFTTMSPIVVRDHDKASNKDWYHSFNDKDYMEILKINLFNQVKDLFDFDPRRDIENLELTIFKNKDVKVKNYDIEVLANLATFELQGENYLLDYFYKAGFASKTSGGFGMLRIAD